MTLDQIIEWINGTIIQNEKRLEQLVIKGRRPNIFSVIDGGYIRVNVNLEGVPFEMVIVYGTECDNFSCVVFDDDRSDSDKVTLVWNLQSIPPNDEDWFTLLHEFGHIMSSEPLDDPVEEEYRAWRWALTNAPAGFDFPIESVVNDLSSYHSIYNRPASNEYIRSKLLQYFT